MWEEDMHSLRKGVRVMQQDSVPQLHPNTMKPEFA